MKTAAYWCVAVAILMVGLAMARSWENPSITALEWVLRGIGIWMENSTGLRGAWIIQ